MTTAPLIDDTANETTDFVLAELDRMREQLSAIEAALPDYGPSFSALEQQAAHIKAQIDQIATSPSVKLSVEQHASKSALAVAETIAPTLAKLQTSIGRLDNLHGELVHLTNRLHIRSNHWPFPVLVPVIGIVVGFMLYPLLARTLPNGANLTAITTGHRDPWMAGEQLMRDANPGGMAAIIRASHVLTANRDAFTRCQMQAKQTNNMQNCSISVAPFAE
jgi:xanthosine utilization system XapX-like protein